MPFFRIMGYSDPRLSQKEILHFWLPLAASWMLMASEGPILQAAIARLPDMQTQLAAFGVVMGLEITIESPVIMLLATSTALATSAHNYRTLRRFMIWTNLGVTLVAFVAAFTPVFDWLVPGIMGIPPEIAEAVRPGMQILTPWSAAIGVRRFQQGVLIRNRQTRWVGLGTGVRLVSSAGTAIGLALLTDLSGVAVVCVGLMLGVSVEALFIALAARPTIARIAAQPEAGTEKLSMGDVVRFHAPLAGTSFMALLAQPLIGAGLARMPQPAESLAAWPVIWGVMFVFRSPAFALPEAVIALLAEWRNFQPVRRFCHRVGIASALLLLMLTMTPLIHLYLRHVAGLPDELAGFVIPGLLLAVMIPYINAVHSWFRGLLMAVRSTREVYWGMGLGLIALALVILVGTGWRTPGIVTAVAALIVSSLAELYYLRIKSRGAEKCNR